MGRFSNPFRGEPLNRGTRRPNRNPSFAPDPLERRLKPSGGAYVGAFLSEPAPPPSGGVPDMEPMPQVPESAG